MHCQAQNNTCWIVKLSVLENNQLGLQYEPFYRLLSALTDLGAYGHMFRFATQFKTWYELLVGDVEELVNHEQFLEFEDRATHTSTVFLVEGKALLYVWAPDLKKWPSK